jgi:hypothetical protein
MTFLRRNGLPSRLPRHAAAMIALLASGEVREDKPDGPDQGQFAFRMS